MKKKGMRIAALWLMLAALVLIYTDRDEYTWRFAGESLGDVLLTCERAQQRETDAQAAMDAEKAEAAARSQMGGWGKADQYGGAPKTRDAADGQTGLNLMWGEYEVSIAYASPAAFDVETVSPLRASFIRSGHMRMEAGEGTAEFVLTLTDACEQLAFACDLPEGACIDALTVHKKGAGVFSADLAAYAVLAGAVLTVLLTLSDKKGEKEQLDRRDALVVVLTALFASMPLLWKGVYDGHDLFFHLNRIEGMAAAMRAGQFPVRIHASTLLGYGYAAPQFYPELFLYIPALLRNLGVSLAASVRVFEMMINFASAGVCYASARALLRDRHAALGACMLYMLCSYRLSSLYVRAALAEGVAMIFFPLLIWALYEVLVGDERKWPLLALAMTGIFMSHLLSTMFAVMMCVLSALCCAPKLIARPRRVLACVKAAAVMALSSAWFLVPFLDYARAGISTSVAVMASEHVLRAGALFVGFPGQAADLAYEATDFAYTVGVVPGLAVMLGCAALVVQLYMAGRRDGRDTLCAVMLGMSAVLLLGATPAFPWTWACNLPRPYSTFFMQIQYPWRLVGMAVPMMALPAAWGLMRNAQHRTHALVLTAALCAVFAGYSMQVFVQDVPLLEKEDFCDTRIEQYEYTYERTEKSALEPGEVIALNAPAYSVRDFSKQGTNLSLTLDAPQGLSSLEVPLLYYPGYRAQANGQDCRVSIGTNNVIRLYGVPDGENIAIRVWFEPPVVWLCAQAVSVLGMAMLLGALAMMKRRARA